MSLLFTMAVVCISKIVLFSYKKMLGYTFFFNYTEEMLLFLTIPAVFLQFARTFHIKAWKFVKIFSLFRSFSRALF